MSHYQQNPPQAIKEQYSQMYTLKSIDSGDQYIELLSGYQVNNQQPQIKSGHWSNKEHIKYIMFLQYFADLFALKHNKKLWKIFTIMSNFIKTRNSSQCRSHHQKTQRKYASIQQILKQEKNKYRNYQLQYAKMKKILKRLPIKSPQQKVIQRISLDLPSIKVLQENVQLKFFKSKNIASDKQITGTRLFSSPTLKGSKNLISTNYPKQSKKQKQFNSQCSISMQDENELLKPPSITRKNIKWGTLEPKCQIDESVNQSISQNEQKKKNQLKTNETYIDNKVKTKKIRSSMPIFEKDSYQHDFTFQDKNINYKIQITQVNKCQTSPRKSSSQQIQSSFQNKSISNQVYFLGAVSSMQYEVQNFIFDQQHPNLLFPMDNNIQQNAINNNEIVSHEPIMKRRSKDDSVYQHKQKVQKIQKNNKTSKFVENQLKKQKPSTLKPQKTLYASLQEPEQKKKQQQPQIKYEQYEYNTMYNYFHQYSPHMNQIYHQPYYPTIYYPPINNSQYFYYQMKNWVQFCVYFWIWKYKMNLLYVSPME